MQRVTTTLLALVALAAALVPSAHAANGEMKLAVEVTGIHVVDWSNRGKDHPQPCKAWIKGQGTQTTGFSTTRPLRYTAFKTPAIAGAPAQFLLLGGTNGKYRATVERQGDWEDHAIPMTRECTPCGDLSEYGKCAEPDPPIAPLYDCGRRKIKLAQTSLSYVSAGHGDRGDDDLVTQLTDKLSVDVVASATGLFRHCPPKLVDDTGRDLQHPDPLTVDFLGAHAKRLQRLRPGRKLTLKGSTEAGYVSEDGRPARETKECSAATLNGTGYRECAVTDVTVEVRRLR